MEALVNSESAGFSQHRVASSSESPGFGNTRTLFSQSLAAMDLADPQMAPEHFFTAPFDSDNFGPTTSKLQTLMQRSHSVGGGLSNYSVPPPPLPISPNPGQGSLQKEALFRTPPINSSGGNSDAGLSQTFSSMRLTGENSNKDGSPPNNVSLPFMSSQNKNSFPAFTSRAEILPNACNVRDYPPLGTQANMLAPQVPEFVPMTAPVSTSAAALVSSTDALLTDSLSRGESPLHSPRSSPAPRRREDKPTPTPLDMSSTPGQQYKPMVQENIGGTTYFYTEDQIPTAAPEVVFPDFHVYPSVPANVAYAKHKTSAPTYFVSEELRADIMNRHLQSLAQVDRNKNPEIPLEVDNYRSLFPLEPAPKNPLDKTSTFGYSSSCFKAINKKDGKLYCLRRIHGFKVSNTQWMVLVDKWKKLQHSNIVSLREVFSTKAFGEHSIVFVHDYHAGATTLMSRHFSHGQSPMSNGFPSSSQFSSKGPKGSFRPHQGLNGPRMASNLLPESLIWTYVVQLSAALRAIHTSGLACRVMDPTKILLLGKSRIWVHCVGIFDVLTFDASQTNPLGMIPHYQQEDLISLGKVILALACNSVQSIQRQHMQASIELVAQNYSSDLKNLILYLLTTQPRPRSVNDIMPLIGARFYTQLDSAQRFNDMIENELAKEIHNGRLFRLMVKLGVINERPEFNGDVSWSETGDRYLLKLFRDNIFHQVTPDGAPWIDMAHVVQCLNKLEAGVPEKVCLASRDEQNVLIVSYADLKKCFVNTFNEVMHAAMASNQ